MRKFYLLLWLFWALRVVVCTLVLSLFFASVLTLFIYVKQGMIAIESEVLTALWEVWKFWFVLFLNISLLIALFRSVKYLFNRCRAGYMLKLKACEKDESSGYIEIVGYGDLVKVWRKWFMLLIWIVGSMMVFAFIITNLFSTYATLFEWFSIYLLYLFIFVAGYLSFVFLPGRCKMLRIVSC
jgi:hypothetical protein